MQNEKNECMDKLIIEEVFKLRVSRDHVTKYPIA
jgi:hypothetical protein